MKYDMKKVSRRVVWAVVVLIVLLIGWIFRPYASHNLAMVDPSVLALKEPCTFAGAVHYLDGGSYGIRLLDRTGCSLDICIAAADDSERGNRRLFVGALHYTEQGAREVNNCHHTRLRVAEIMRAMPEIDRDRDVILAHMTGRWRDFWRVIKRQYISKLYAQRGNQKQPNCE